MDCLSRVYDLIPWNFSLFSFLVRTVSVCYVVLCSTNVVQCVPDSSVTSLRSSGKSCLILSFLLIYFVHYFLQLDISTLVLVSQLQSPSVHVYTEIILQMSVYAYKLHAWNCESILIYTHIINMYEVPGLIFSLFSKFIYF